MQVFEQLSRYAKIEVERYMIISFLSTQEPYTHRAPALD